MKNTKNRIISLLLVLSLVLSLCCGSALAAEESAQDAPAVPSAEEQLPDQEPDGSGEESTSAADQDENAPEASAEEKSAPDENAPEENAEAAGADVSQPEPEKAQAEASQAEASQPEAEEVQPEETQAEAPEAEAAEVQAEEVPEAAEASAAEESVTEQEEAAESFTLNIVETVTLEKEYDDRFTFTEAKSGYVVAQIKDQNPTSKVVSKGKVTSSRDKAVVQLNSGSDTEAVAVGTGTATAVMVSKEDLTEAQALLGMGGTATRSVDAVQVNLEVKPAPLTIMFLGGQSNMEGWGSYPGGKKLKKLFPRPAQSIACPEGEVYSTYAPSGSAFTSGQAYGIGGNVKFKAYCTTGTASKFVHGSLTVNSDTSVYGTVMSYPINQMTTAGNGKNGPDSGLAYEWNRLTGDKVWTVNAAWGGSTTARWLPKGGDCYARAKAIYSCALKVYNAEISAGHFTQAHKLYFWLQGETDAKNGVSASKYLKNFDSMRKGMKQLLGYEKLGIISVRSSVELHYKDARDLTMTGPRIAQTYVANTKSYGDVCIVSDVNEYWVSNNSVRKYFQRAYGSALDYPTHGKTPALPTKVSEVHNDIHYMQVGHNENGLTAARGMYEWMQGTAQATGVKWRNGNGQNITSLNLAKGQTAVLSPAVVNVAASKLVQWKFSSGLSYSARTGKLTVTKNGKQQVQALDANGNVISTLVVSRGSLAAPTLKRASNAKGKKITAQWNKVSGVSGYQVQYALNADFTGAGSVTVKGAGTVKVTLKGLSKKKTYYVRVRSYKSGSTRQYSAWSGAKKVTVSK